jgi:hypothetical protein
MDEAKSAADDRKDDAAEFYRPQAVANELNLTTSELEHRLEIAAASVRNLEIIRAEMIDLDRLEHRA